jgi:anti-sigma regulatory factor (Ser/Thr protein kinase)
MTPHPPTQPETVRLEISSNPLFLAGARELVYHLASRLGFTDEACGQMALAIDEAICNVIRHGYDRQYHKPIWITITALGGVGTPEGQESPTTGLQIVIEDEARQVDISKIKSRDLDDIRPGGLGVHIITEVMDQVKYEHRQPRGMRLTMIKKRVPAGTLNGPAATPPASGKESA